MLPGRSEYLSTFQRYLQSASLSKFMTEQQVFYVCHPLVLIEMTGAKTAVKHSYCILQLYLATCFDPSWTSSGQMPKSHKSTAYICIERY